VCVCVCGLILVFKSLRRSAEETRSLLHNMNGDLSINCAFKKLSAVSILNRYCIIKTFGITPLNERIFNMKRSEMGA
jgi:hypothetical protein